MYNRVLLPVLTALALVACGSRKPDGRVVIDEEITLTRGDHSDVASRELEVEGDSIVVAFVDEQLTDVRLELTVANGQAAAPVEVENNLHGIGIEIARLDVEDDGRVALELTGPQNSDVPGRVHLRVQVFSAAALRDSQFAATLGAYQAWTAATNAKNRTDAFTRSGRADLERAIAALEGPQGNAALAAEARLIEARLLLFFRIDWRGAHAAAQRAAKAFGALPKADALNVARARFQEALALIEMAEEEGGVNPTSEEAIAMARATLEELNAPSSPLGLIERARVAHAMASISYRASRSEDASKYFEESRALFEKAGYRAGVVEMRANLVALLSENGKFADAADRYLAMLPELEKVADPEERVGHFLNAARSLSFAGHTDEALELLLRSLALAREYQMRNYEAAALHELGYVYQNRADLLQARAYFDEVLKIARAEQATSEYVWALSAAGTAAREDGDNETALKMHKEASTRAKNPIAAVRTLYELGLDYAALGDPVAAEASLRASLATSLDDPRHHAYTDVRRQLAQLLIERGGDSRSTLAEADALLATALATCLYVRDKKREMTTHRVTAQLRVAQGRPAEARKEFETTFALARALRLRSVSSDIRTASFPDEQAAFRGYLDLLMGPVVARGVGQPRPVTKNLEAVRRKLEIARDATLDAQYAVRLDAGTNVRVDALLAQMAGKSLEISALLKADAKGADATRLSALQLEMSDLHAQVDRLRTAAQKASSAAHSEGAERAWRALAPGTVQLSYALGNEHVYAWTRSKSGTLVTVLATTPADFERELIELGALDRQADPEKVEQAIAHISAVLLPRDVLPPGAAAVEILAEGRIAGVPFPGLRSPTDMNRRLVETHTVTMIGSLFSTDEPPRPRQARPYRLVALASGHGTLRSAQRFDPMPKLRAATKEIRAVATLFEAREPNARVKLLLGAEGSAAALRGIWGSGADVVHFATHALADLRQPLASLLVLPATNVAGDATYLTAGQVREWRGDAGLVFLSACESAIGPPRFAAGMPGLQDAFLRAGARGVIATLWPIEDLLAQEFSEDFYQRFTSGLPAAESLRATQQAWLSPTGTSDAARMRRRITALAHAYYVR